MSESFLPWEEKLIFEDGDFVCLALMYLAFLASAICRDCFHKSVTKNLAVGGFSIICVSMRH